MKSLYALNLFPNSLWAMTLVLIYIVNQQTHVPTFVSDEPDAESYKQQQKREKSVSKAKD